MVGPFSRDVVDKEASLLLACLGPRLASGVGLDYELSLVFCDGAQPHELVHVIATIEVHKGVLGDNRRRFFRD